MASIAMNSGLFNDRARSLFSMAPSNNSATSSTSIVSTMEKSAVTLDVLLREVVTSNKDTLKVMQQQVKLLTGIAKKDSGLGFSDLILARYLGKFLGSAALAGGMAVAGIGALARSGARMVMSAASGIFNKTGGIIINGVKSMLTLASDAITAAGRPMLSTMRGLRAMTSLGNMTKIGGALIAIAPKALSVIGRIGSKFLLPLTAILGAFDAFKGFTNAEKILGRSNVGIGGKLLAGVTNAVDGLLLGIPSWLSQKLGFENFSQALDQTLVSTYAKIESSVVSISNSIGEGISSLVSSIASGVSKLGAKLKEWGTWSWDALSHGGALEHLRTPPKPSASISGSGGANLGSMLGNLAGNADAEMARELSRAAALTAIGKMSAPSISDNKDNTPAASQIIPQQPTQATQPASQIIPQQPLQATQTQSAVTPVTPSAVGAAVGAAAGAAIAASRDYERIVDTSVKAITNTAKESKSILERVFSKETAEALDKLGEGLAGAYDTLKADMNKTMDSIGPALTQYYGKNYSTDYIGSGSGTVTQFPSRGSVGGSGGSSGVGAPIRMSQLPAGGGRTGAAIGGAITGAGSTAGGPSGTVAAGNRATQAFTPTFTGGNAQSSALTDNKGRVISTASTDMPVHQRAFLDTLAMGNATSGGAYWESPDYNTIVGGKKFDSFADHPRIFGTATSTAAGRYQFTKTTWDDVVKRYNRQNPTNPIKDFSPQNQDRAAYFLAKSDYARRTGGRSLDDDLRNNDPNIGQFIKTGLGGYGANTTWEILQKKSAGEISNAYAANLARNQSYTAGGQQFGQQKATDILPPSVLNMRVKASNGQTTTVGAMGITTYSDLQRKGGQAFSGGYNDPNTTWITSKIQEDLGDNFNRVTAQNDQYHQRNAPRSRHTKGSKTDFTVSGISEAEGHRRTSEMLTRKYGLTEGKDFKMISSPHGTGKHIDFELTDTGRSRVESLRATEAQSIMNAGIPQTPGLDAIKSPTTDSIRAQMGAEAPRISQEWKDYRDKFAAGTPQRAEIDKFISGMSETQRAGKPSIGDDGSLKSSGIGTMVPESVRFSTNRTSFDPTSESYWNKSYEDRMGNKNSAEGVINRQMEARGGALSPLSGATRAEELAGGGIGSARNVMESFGGKVDSPVAQGNISAGSEIAIKTAGFGPNANSLMSNSGMLSGTSVADQTTSLQAPSLSKMALRGDLNTGGAASSFAPSDSAAQKGFAKAIADGLSNAEPPKQNSFTPAGPSAAGIEPAAPANSEVAKNPTGKSTETPQAAPSIKDTPSVDELSMLMPNSSMQS